MYFAYGLWHSKEQSNRGQYDTLDGDTYANVEHVVNPDCFLTTMKNDEF